MDHLFEDEIHKSALIFTFENKFFLQVTWENNPARLTLVTHGLC